MKHRMKDVGETPAFSLMDATADDSDKKRHVQVDEVEELTLILPLPEDSKSSPTKSLQSRSPKRSPTKPNASLLNIDPTATLAAISARLAIVVPPGESEITRINREVLEAMANRTKRQDFAMDDKVPDSDMSSTAPSSPTTKSGMTPALHDSVVAEEWVNLHLETSGAFLLPATDIAPLLASATTGDDELDADQEAFAFRKGNVSGPLARAGMDRFSLYRMGMPKDLVDRLYRAFYVYTNGFHNIIKEVAAHCPPRVESHVSSNAWLTFLLLLEQCEDGKYEMAMLKFKQAAQETTKQLQEGFQRENQDIESQLRSTASALSEETVRGAEKSELIRKLVTETTESSLKMADQHQRLTAQAEQIRLLKLEVLVHEDEEKKLNELLDDTRRDYEVANSERLNALSERFALDEEIRKLSTQLERVESEKANYARRMHETLFMNQALRANNDQLKQDVVILGMEKDKIIAEKQALQDQVERINLEITQLQEQKSQVDKELIENQRKQGHLEERLQTMKEQFDIEVEQTAKHQQEIVKLSAQIEEERVQTGVLEAKCNLLSAAKQNTGMRAQDKLRIERLLNQKTELEAVVEAAKLDRKKDEEQISNLRSSLEALDAEMQHSKRVYSAGQQAFLHSERTCEQLRQQMQELEKNYEKAKKNVASLKERFKMYEVMAKEQITKLEVEVKVTNAQLREVTYVNRDNAAQIDQLKKSLTVAEKESMVLKTKIEESEKQVENLENEKEGLQRNKKELDLASSTSKDAINRFILSLQNMLALVKLDEFPLDEALRELLQLVQDTFGEELDLDKVLDEDDRPEDIELEIEEDVTDEERQSRRRRAAARRKGIINVDDPDDDGEKDETITPEAETTDGQATGRRETVRMSRHRKSKLDHLVSKLHRDIATKVSLIADLENVVCDQSVQISHLITTTKQQARLIFLNECQKGMLHADLEDTLLMLIGIRADKRVVEYSLEQARIDQVLQTNRAFQAEVNLGVLRRKFDMQVIANEDLIAKIWREYEDMLYMKSLRRDKEVQATVIVSNQDSQTLVPQRNPAMERPRVTSLYMPADADGAAETLLQKITRATRELLPNVASEMELHIPVGKPRPQDNRNKRGLVRPLASSPRSSRTQPRTQASQDESRRRHPGNRRRNPPSSLRETGTSALPHLDDNNSAQALSPSQMIHHVNEFGARQRILLSPERPPYFDDQASNRTSDGLPPHPPTHNSLHHGKSQPRKPNKDKRPPLNHMQLDTQFEERVESPRNARQLNRSPITLPRPRHVSPPSPSSDNTGGLRSNRSFLRAGMEVVRKPGRNVHRMLVSGDGLAENVDPEGSDDSNNEGIDDSADERDLDGEEDESDEPVSVESPSRLAAAVSGYQREQIARQEAEWRNQLPSPRRFGSNSDQKRDEVREGGVVDGMPVIDSKMAEQAQHSPFTTAVLYPILPQQQRQ